MRLICWLCQKSVSNEVPTDTVIRAILICPECIEAQRVTFLGDDPPVIVIPDDDPQGR